MAAAQSGKTLEAAQRGLARSAASGPPHQRASIYIFPEAK